MLNKRKEYKVITIDTSGLDSGDKLYMKMIHEDDQSILRIQYLLSLSGWRIWIWWTWM